MVRPDAAEEKRLQGYLGLIMVKDNMQRGVPVVSCNGLNKYGIVFQSC